MNDKYEYKGIFYDDISERKFYEGGAHFSYQALVNVLKKIKKHQMKEKEYDSEKESILKQVPIVSRQKNFSMKNIFSCDNPMIKYNYAKKNNINNKNNENNFNIKIKKVNLLRNNVSKEKSLSMKKLKSGKKNMNQSNSVIQIGSGQCLNININNNYNNNFININPNNNINNNIILNNNNSNPLRFIKELLNENKSGKKKPQSRNSKSKGRNYKRKNNNINSSIEFNREYNYNYNYYLVEAGLDKSAKLSGNKNSGKSTGAQASNSVHNISINGLNNLNLTKYSQSNRGLFGLNLLDNSINSSKIFKKNKAGNSNKKVVESENKINDKKNDKEYYIKKNKNKGALSLDKNNKNNFNSFINNNIKLNNFVNNKDQKKGVFRPIILNENNIKKLKNFNMTIFNISSNKNKNSSSKEKNNVDYKNNICKNISKNNNNSNRSILKFANQSLLKSICLQKQNSRNIFNFSLKNKKKNLVNIPNKLSEKSCSIIGKLIQKQNNISRNSKINYDKLIKSFEG